MDAPLWLRAMDDAERERRLELMLCYKPDIKPEGASRLRIEPSTVGYYVFVWLDDDSVAPERDHLQDTLEMAKEQCAENFAVPETAWTAYEEAQPLNGWTD